MIVTTAERPTAEQLGQAARLAEEMGARCVPRRRDTLRGLMQKYETDGVLVVGADGLRYVSEDRPPLFFHPSMGLIRVKRLIAGGTDGMIAASGAAPGDTVLDCTAGLASDALVFSHAVGAAGKVIAIEASPLLYMIVREGLQAADTGQPEADAACRRIDMRLGDHAELLRGMADRSVDIVYFDPMFERPVRSSSSMFPLRSLAKRDPLSEETVREAVRVARKSVMMKNSNGSAQFSRLEFVPARHSTSAVCYGVIAIDAVE